MSSSAPLDASARVAYKLLPLCRSYKDAGHKDQCAAKDDLHDRRPESHFEIAVADIPDGEQFDADDEVREIQRSREVGQEEGKRVKDAADKRRNADDAAADSGVAA